MDRVREEFNDLLTLVDKADNVRLPAAWSDLVEYAAESFARGSLDPPASRRGRITRSTTAWCWR